jgi:hypothetical protein
MLVYIYQLLNKFFLLKVLYNNYAVFILQERMHINWRYKNMKEVSAKWSVNENLLQWYRSIFISSQSFLLIVLTLFLEKSTGTFYGIWFVSMLIILYIWFPVVISRHRIIDYYKYMIDLDSESISQLCTENEYVNCKEKRNEANRILHIDTNWRSTRRRIDGLLPILFIFVLILLFIYKIFN